MAFIKLTFFIKTAKPPCLAIPFVFGAKFSFSYQAARLAFLRLAGIARTKTFVRASSFRRLMGEDERFYACPVYITGVA